jgi:hypothetical protein
MPAKRRVAIAVLLLLVVSTIGVVVAQVADVPAGPGPGAVGRTPPRLGFIDGQVSFWRPGAEEWVTARLNTALAPGDELYTGSPGNVELQIGGRAYVRAWAGTQLGLASLEPDFVQLKVTTGYVSLDLRRLDPGHTIEVDTPNAAFTIEVPGYYRIDVTENRTTFITRRSGRATVTPAAGSAATVAPSEEVVVEGPDGSRVATYVAPELDVWDRWNYARTEALIDSLSIRYVPGDVYGIDDLDHHGAWRDVDTYGAVWVPTGVPGGWAPYSMGSWMWDPYYGWTWVDSAAWGWAPYHYGRWVYVSDVWAWAPGPMVVRPVYAPALVAFLGVRVGISLGIPGPTLGWVALGWGEPLIPWWGPVGFIGVPRWLGWGGPRIVNDTVVGRTRVIHADEIHAYRNVGVGHAVTVIPRDRFGHGPVHPARVSADPRQLEPIHGKLDLAPGRASLVPDHTRGARPPETTLHRPVVATRAPADPARWLKPHGIPEPTAPPTASPRLVAAPPRRVDGAEGPPRPPFGPSKIERRQSAPPPRPGAAQPPASSPPARAGAPRTRPPAAPPGGSGQAKPTPTVPRVAPGPTAPTTPRAPAPTSRALPGEPANRLFPGHSQQGPGRPAPPSVRAPSAGHATPSPKRAPAPGR